MTDHDFLTKAFRGDADAVNLILLLSRVSHVWDDLVDLDKPVDEITINRTFYALLIDLPSNPFFRRHMDTLLPLMAMGAMNYEIANAYELSGDRERLALAHVLRYSVADVATATALLIGGPEWVRMIGPELRQLSQKDTLDHYRSEHSDHGYELETSEYLAQGLLLFQATPLGETDQAASDALLGYAQIAPGATVIDMGCGVAGLQRTTSVADLHFKNVTNCQAQVTEIGRVGLQAVFADFADTGLPGAQADAVIFCESFGYGKTDALLAETFRLLKPGGRCVIKDVIPTVGANPSILRSWGYRPTSPTTMIDAAFRAGLELVQLVTPKTYPAKWRDVMAKSAQFQALHDCINGAGKSCVYIFQKGATP